MKKKIVSITLACMMLAGATLAGCGSKDDAATTDGNGTSISQEEQGDEEETEDSSTEKEEISITSDELDTSEIYGADNSDIKIGLTLMSYDMTFFQDMLAQIRATADELGITVIDYDGGNDVAQQANAVDDLLAQNVDALFLNPVDGDAIGGAVLQANSDGVPVVTVDVRSIEGDIVCHTSSDNLMIGEEAAKAAVEALVERNGSEKGIVYILGFDAVSSMRDRVKGFTAYLDQYPDIEYVHEEPVTLTTEATLEKMEAALQTYGEGSVDLIYGANETTAVGILSAAEAAGRTDFGVVGVDDSPVLNEALANPDSIYLASVVQDPMNMGKVGVELAVMAAKGIDPKATYVGTSLKTITKDTIASYLEELEAKRAELAEYYN